MSKLMKLSEFELVDNKKINTKTLYLTEALTRMRNRNQFHQEDYEDVICPFELMLTLYEVANDFNEYRGNKNGTK